MNGPCSQAGTTTTGRAAWRRMKMLGRRVGRRSGSRANGGRAGQQSFNGDAGLEAGQRRPHAEVDAAPEGEVRALASPRATAGTVVISRRRSVGRRPHQQHPAAGGDVDATEGGGDRGVAVVELEGPVGAQHVLEELGDAAGSRRRRSWRSASRARISTEVDKRLAVVSEPALTKTVSMLSTSTSVSSPSSRRPANIPMIPAAFAAREGERLLQPPMGEHAQLHGRLPGAGDAVGVGDAVEKGAGAQRDGDHPRHVRRRQAEHLADRARRGPGR